MDERQRLHEEHEKARKQKHSEWHKKKEEDLRRRLMKVYGNGSENNFSKYKFTVLTTCLLILLSFLLFAKYLLMWVGVFFRFAYVNIITWTRPKYGLVKVKRI